MKSNALCYGDNLRWMREEMKGGNSIDLIYLDPPFNSKANYNLLYKNSDGANSQAQAEAF